MGRVTVHFFKFPTFLVYLVFGRYLEDISLDTSTLEPSHGIWFACNS